MRLAQLDRRRGLIRRFQLSAGPTGQAVPAGAIRRCQHLVVERR